jgi:hypothetical protein
MKSSGNKGPPYARIQSQGYRHEGRTQSPFKQQIHPGDDLN